MTTSIMRIIMQIELLWNLFFLLNSSDWVGSSAFTFHSAGTASRGVNILEKQSKRRPQLSPSIGVWSIWKGDTPHVFPFSHNMQGQEEDATVLSPNDKRPEYAALIPGQILSVQVGDVSMARKAWKKRRRSDSPILVPCTILGMDRETMVKFTVMNMVHSFGRKLNEAEQSVIVGDTSDSIVMEGILGDGVALSCTKIAKLYKYRLGGDLWAHAKAFGHASVEAMLGEFFDKPFQDEYGIKLIHNLGPSKTSYVTSTFSHRLAREYARKSAWVQFVASPQLLSAVPSSHDMIHTGYTLLSHLHSTSSNDSPSDSNNRAEPLSVALRLSQADAESQRVTEGMILNSFVLSFDIQGDNASPLLTFAIDPPKSQSRDQMKRRDHIRRVLQMRQRTEEENLLLLRRQEQEQGLTATTKINEGEQQKHTREKNKNRRPTKETKDAESLFGLVKIKTNQKSFDISELAVGDGPYRATVMRVSPRTNAVFVDVGVSRKRGKKHGGGRARVLGMLLLDQKFPNESPSRIENQRADSKKNGEANVYPSDFSKKETSIIEQSIREDEESEDYADEDDDSIHAELTVNDLFLSDDDYADIDDDDDDDDGEDNDFHYDNTEEEDEEEEEEEEENITQLYSIDNDGNLTERDHTNPQTESWTSLSVSDDNYDDVTALEQMSPVQRIQFISRILDSQNDKRGSAKTSSTLEFSSTNDRHNFNPKMMDSSRLSMGDEIEVYIKAIFPQSGRFMVTLDENTKNKKLRDLKREKEAEKRISRLNKKQRAGKIIETVGFECAGTIRAKSKTGPWYYVEPENSSNNILTTGRGNLISSECEDLLKGRRVWLRLDGIDETKGQLSYSILRSL